jgi:3-phenylpropionate/trans-cinnamate dioxygenase ferredoxin subunit
MSSHEVPVCKVGDIQPGSRRRFEVGNIAVCVVRIGDDFYAINDKCSHADFSLCEGELLPEEREIECWKHGSTFSLLTGEPQSLPATKPVPVYDVKIVDDDVVVTVK